jgi:hypothetical protein
MRGSRFFERACVRPAVALNCSARWLVLVGLAAGVVNCASAMQSECDVRLPDFSDYVADVFFGPYAAPDPAASDPEARELLLPVLAEVRASAQRGANFAGHYYLAESVDYAMGRHTALVIDLKTGRAFLPPALDQYSDGRGAGVLAPRADGGLKYRRISRLLILSGAPGTARGITATHYLRWTGTDFAHLGYLPDGTSAP